MYNYSFTVNNANCPHCNNDLSQDNAVKVKSPTINRPIKTNVGKDGDFTGYVMDGNMEDATLILADTTPTVYCNDCNGLIPITPHRE